MWKPRVKARGFHNTVAQGGYFGWNLDALDDCLSGGFAAGAPFRLARQPMCSARRRGRQHCLSACAPQAGPLRPGLTDRGAADHAQG